MKTIVLKTDCGLGEAEGRSARITRDEDGEYRVRHFRGLITREAEDYFTGDKTDAVKTAALFVWPALAHRFGDNTPAQALERFAKANGKGWVEKLQGHWYSARVSYSPDGAILHYLRNNYGHEVLAQTAAHWGQA